MDSRQRGEFTGDRFAEPPRPGADRLMVVTDQINAREGRGTAQPGRIPAYSDWSMKCQMMSQRYSTRWGELMAVR